jgi:NAD-dependent deacetylase
MDLPLVRRHVGSRGRVSVLTGAGISAESGIPTFRGPEGYWTVGSREYHPQQMATLAMFGRHPLEVWKWYLYRASACGRAAPNPGHRALVALEACLGDRFTLITQNVDGLHIRAGNSPDRTYQIHGNLFQMRCAAGCSGDLHPLPEALVGRERDAPVSRSDLALLSCPLCGEITRPHVLWFDELYNETFFHFESTLRAAARTALLIVVGTSGSTNLPNQVAHGVYRNGGTIIDINVDDNPFAQMAARTPFGGTIRQPSARALPDLVAAIIG